ncbi:hypothetical protein OG455_16180 [Kitasatospora sp. NBC_01287]|uniref:hypothetical protein n=1 Tax=Kitasatospora sp. NBC_01287 TaxID=2903573 RepID=UPI00225A93C5|nr:hypothetical protein [Kitasatospora sp. NBC_01287]MCX4747046.1 hypothetical protein [Kitasatospora sp. NBC_01287]
MTTALVVSGAFATGVLVYRWTAPSEGATALSRGERLALALGAAATVIMIGGYLGNGFRGIGHTANAQPAGAMEAVKPGVGR